MSPISLDVSALKKVLPSLDSKRLDRAIAYAKEKYEDRQFGILTKQTLFDHAMESTMFLAEFCRDEDALIASILQHALRVPESSLEEVGKIFGRSVRDLVSRVHLLSHLYTTDWKRSVEDMKLMLVSVSDDVRVLLITLAVVSKLLENLDSVDPSCRTRLCKQSLQLFAPVAARLGIYALKYRLERYAFAECYPTDAERIGQQLQMVHDESGGFLPRTASAVLTFLRNEGIEAEVMAREKQPFSIFQKMHTKSENSLEKVTDLFAVRVVVPKVEDCYQALGLLHRMGTPISSRFKDYISFPKPNGYRSLHTCVIGLPHAPRSVMVEVQIRTNEMHQEAEYGVAAHWMYKAVGKKGKVQQSAEKLEFADILMNQQSALQKKKGETMPSLVNHIFTLTPHGDIIELPEGGTPLDFAFLVHSDLGIKFKGARVNGNIVPIGMKLENGDVVEILTHKHPLPTLQWLKVLATPSARAKLKSYFLSHNRAEYLAKGRETMNKELKARKLPPLDPDMSILASVDGRTLSVKEREDIIVKMGMDSVKPSSVLRGIPQEKRGTVQEEKKKKVATLAGTKSSALVRVIGEPLSLPYRFAKCCAPEKLSARPDIFGVVNMNGRITVHMKKCKVIKGVTPSRKLAMEWIEKEEKKTKNG